MSEPSDVRRCGRPTRSGTPCQALLHGFDVSCKSHAAEDDSELAKWYERGLHTGLRRGQEMAGWTAQHNVERVKELEHQVQELKQKLEDASRYYEIEGDQVVEVDGRYAYRWGGSPRLEIGELVVLPPNWLTTTVLGSGSFDGTVTGFGTTYQGQLSHIVRRALPGSQDNG